VFVLQWQVFNLKALTAHKRGDKDNEMRDEMKCKNGNVTI
jgi:hypothetical protein